jgi:signal transduction histidine kinase
VTKPPPRSRSYRLAFGILPPKETGLNKLSADAIAPAAEWAKPGRVLWIGLLATAYYASARFGTSLEFSGPVAAIVWLPAGVGIAFLTLGGIGLWPGVLIGDLLANDYSAQPLGSALATTGGNIVEVVVAAWLIRRTLQRDNPLGTPAQVGRIIVALSIGCAISATVGVLATTLGGVTKSDAAWTTWRTWWLGDCVGALVVVPFALAWARPLSKRMSRERAPEFAALIVAILVLGEIALTHDQPLTYVMFPLLIWAALRFGQRGSTLALVLVTALAVWNTTHYHGPFVFHSITRSVLATQLFIAVAAVTALLLESLVSEKEDLSAQIVSSRARLLEASDRERRRLERNLHDGAQQRLVAIASLIHGARLEVGDEAPAARLLEQAEAEAREANAELRELAGGIHPSVLTDFGLAHAVRSVAQRASVEVVLGELPADRLDATVEAAAYYVVLEAVANAQKHSHASCIWVSAPVLDGVLALKISDDGIGGAVERAGGGLEGLRDRVETTGGRFAFQSSAGRGTSITAVFPA